MTVTIHASKGVRSMTPDDFIVIEFLVQRGVRVGIVLGSWMWTTGDPIYQRVVG